MTRRSPLPVLLPALGLAFLSGCASSEVGFGLPTLDASAASAAIADGDAEPRPVSGTLAVESNGCFTWSTGEGADRLWVVWPDDARQDGDGVILGSGERIVAGSELEGLGANVELADLPGGGNSDSYFASFGTFCSADATGVLVLTQVATG
jgi:hypothetical protein